MKNNYKIFIDPLYGWAANGDQIIDDFFSFKDYEDKNLFDKFSLKFKSYVKDYKEENIKESLEMIFDIFKNSQNLEIVDLDLINKRAKYSFNSNTIKYSHALICRLDEENQKKFNNVKSIVVYLSILDYAKEFLLMVRTINFFDNFLELLPEEEVIKFDSKNSSLQFSYYKPKEIANNTELLEVYQKDFVNTFGPNSNKKVSKFFYLLQFLEHFKSFAKHLNFEDVEGYFFEDHNITLKPNEKRLIKFLINNDNREKAYLFKMPVKFSENIFNYEAEFILEKIKNEPSSTILKLENEVIRIYSKLMDLSEEYNRLVASDLYKKINLDDSKLSEKYKVMKQNLNLYIKTIENNFNWLKNNFTQLEVMLNKIHQNKLHVVNLRNVRNSKIEFEKFNPDFLEFENSTFKFEHNNKIIFDKFDNYLLNLKRTLLGFYKNPYISFLLEKPSALLSVKSELHTSFKLNEEQKEAARKAIGNNLATYVQGGSGTGKTQVVSAVGEHIVAYENKTFLITSTEKKSLIEVFERINNVQKNNPNLFFLLKGKKNKFNEKNLYKRFVNAMLENVSPSSEEEIASCEILSDLKNNFSNLELNELFFITNFSYEQILEKDIIDNYFYLTGYRLKDFLEKINSDDESEIKDMVNMKIQSTYKKLQNKFLIEDINNMKSIIKNSKGQAETFEQLTNTNKDNKNSNMFDEIRNRFNNKNNGHSNSEHFFDILIEKKLINLIGVTNSESKTIELNKKTFDLFVNYPIDLTAFDDVSKSSIFEILDFVRFSKKILFAGDYMQLAPFGDIEKYDGKNDNVIKAFFDFLHDSFDGRKIELSPEMKEYYKEQEFVNDLKYSLFKNNVMDIKKYGSKETSGLNILTKNYKFNNEIVEFVNSIYADDEKMKLADDKENEKYQNIILKADKDYEQKINIIDTSYLCNDFYENVYKKNTSLGINADKSSFDQMMFIDKNKYNYAPSRFNEFNAYWVLKSLKNIVKNNKVDPSDIGIIAMSSSQVKLIRQLIENDEKLKQFSTQIEVDTVNNFQGKTKEIVIFDMVRASKDLYNNKKSLQKAKRNMEFYNKLERLNVAVSRAKSKLIIIGAFQNYLLDDELNNIFSDTSKQIIPVFSNWYNMVNDKNGVLNAWEVHL
ncbi:AAA family ATPase [Spiroplasma chinense]|uniref:AAA family ATPase n=1 Tax=Spiroplasma chinense TaxID=216932 RepID=A0A5B9Y580_9MOLU|nr:AAA domain-containing protein [Spiroplasma chinense]QEH61975.1 AAA family ATPase [Spiroplasma chinense]